MQALHERGGVLCAQDLADHRSEITDPICSTYRNHTIYEVPPPTAVSTARWTSVLCLCLCELGGCCCHLLALHVAACQQTRHCGTHCFCLCLCMVGRTCYVWATPCRHCTLSASPAILPRHVPPQQVHTVYSLALASTSSAIKMQQGLHRLAFEHRASSCGRCSPAASTASLPPKARLIVLVWAVSADVTSQAWLQALPAIRRPFCKCRVWWPCWR